MSSVASVPGRVKVLDQALRKALAEIRAGSPGDLVARAQHARDRLREALGRVSAAGCGLPLRQALACAEAADEHLEYGELLEARTLLTAARRQLAVLSAPPAQPEPVLPAPRQ